MGTFQFRKQAGVVGRRGGRRGGAGGGGILVPRLLFFTIGKAKSQQQRGFMWRPAVALLLAATVLATVDGVGLNCAYGEGHVLSAYQWPRAEHHGGCS
jgi:hypothetical protein